MFTAISYGWKLEPALFFVEEYFVWLHYERMHQLIYKHLYTSQQVAQ
jgi:sRNA-binding regulator protein Hfq